MTDQTVSKWKDGQVVPDPERWPTIEAALGMEPGHLSALSGLPTSADRLEELRARIRAEVLAEVGDQLSEIRDQLARLAGEVRE